MFNLEPVKFEDFSGGETDFYLLGGKTRYERATNYLVTAQKKLEMRPGSGPFDWLLNHITPSSPTRIGSFFTFNNERELLVQQAQNLYYLSSSWTAITGPEGSPAAPTTGDFDAMNFAEWKGHTYFTSAGGGRPGKLYRTPGGEFRVRTVGLPLPASEPKFTETSLLAACIALANDLRQSFVNHINDTNLHDAVDKWSLSYFTAQSWTPVVDEEYPGPQPAPTPAPAATDEDSLYALIEALSLAYEHHGYESGSAQHYHKTITITVANASTTPPKGPFKRLTENTAPDNLLDAATHLNELHQRWNWHRLAVFTHSATNTYAAMNLYPTSVAKLENVSYDAVPYLQSNYSEVVRYANYLKYLHNVHVSFAEEGADFNDDPSWSGGHWHSQLIDSAQDALVKLPDAVDLDSAYLIIYWVWALYGGVHFADANIPAHTNFTMDTTAGSADVTDVKTGAGALTLPVGAIVIATSAIFNGDDGAGRNSRSAEVLASASGTATLSRTLVSTTTADQACQYSLSLYHGGFTTAGALETKTTTEVTADETPDPRPGSGLAANNIAVVPSTLEGWITLADECFNMLHAHMLNREVHGAGVFPSDYLYGNGPFYKPQIATYSYAFVYKYRYETENGVTFQNESEPIFIGNIETAKQYPVNTDLATGLPEEDTSTFANDGGFVSTHVEEVASATIKALPRLRNTPHTNYAVDDVTIEIFRTQDGGTTYYLIGEVDNGETSFDDEVSDTTGTTRSPALNDRDPLYTTGGEVARTQAPEARYLQIIENTAYYGYVFDTGQSFPERVVQSIPGAPDTGPADFSHDFPDELVGLSQAKKNLIAHGKGNLYRLTGGFNNLGQGSMSHETIGDKIGTVSTKSIVLTKHGVFFAGLDGFYWTDGFQHVKLSIDRDESYKKLVQTEEQASRIYGCYDHVNQRIWWSVQSESSGQDVDRSWIFHINFGIKPSGVFTSADNGSYWAPSAMVFHNGRMIRGDKRGVIFLHDEKYHSDPKIPSSGAYEDFIPVDQWGTVHVPFNFRSCAVDFGDLANGNYVVKCKLIGKNVGNAAIQVNSIADNNYSTSSQKSAAPMLYLNNLRWGDPTVQWGGGTRWQYDGKFDMTRRLAHGNLRAQLKQVEFVPARVGVYNYDQYPADSYVDVDITYRDTTGIKVTLQEPTDYEGQDFPRDVVDMYIAFEDDDYETEYLITAWAQEELTITDPDEVLYENLYNQKWVIRGYLKEARHTIHGFVLHEGKLGPRGNLVGGETGGGENAE